MNRYHNSKTTKTIILFIYIFLFLSISSAYGKINSNLLPAKLKCEYLSNPMTIERSSPRLTWKNIQYNKNIRGEKTTAWQIHVASSQEMLLDEKADIWDSGKQKNNDAPYVVYKGKELQSRKTYWWRVRVWDRKGNISEWSKPAYWGMGIQKAEEWVAKWIGAPWQGEEPREKISGCPHTPAPLLKKDFNINSAVKSAKIFTTGLGYFELYLNGEKVGDEVLSPNQTNYSKRNGLDKKNIPIDDEFRGYNVMYTGYDITEKLKIGKNTIGCILGNGFYNSVRHWISAYGSPRFIAQLHIEYENGKNETIISDESWSALESAIRINDVYEGETYDARYETANWSSPLCNTGKWEKAVIRKAPTGKLTGQFGPADKIMEKLSPVKITQKRNGIYEVCFAEEISGWIRLKNICGTRGDTIRIKYISESPNGSNVYVLNGSGNESYATRFTWYVFSKVEIEGWNGKLTEQDITAEAVYSDVETNGEFQCSNEILNKINKIWLRSQKDNMHGSIASDCPHRERSAYTGDGQVACTAVMHNLDAKAFYNKWITDIYLSQNIKTGYIPNGAPWQPGCGGGVAWGAAMNIMPWEYYLHYGDKILLEEMYEAMKAQTDYMQQWETKEGTMFSQAPSPEKKIYWMNLGEWCAPYENPSDELVHTFYWWMCADIISRAAKALDKPEDVTKYEETAKKIKNAFHNKFYNAEKGTYGENGANIFALKMGIPEEENRKKTIKSLKKEIEKRDGHLMTGIFGTRYLFETLAENDMNEEALEMLEKRDFPSFGYWIEQGATTTWEQWNGANSRNHPMFGGGLTWLYRVLAGIKCDEHNPGYRHFFVSPEIPEKSDSVSYTLQSPYGEIQSSWKKENGHLIIGITVPVNSNATFELPLPYEKCHITEGGKSLKRAKGIKVTGKRNGKIIMEAESGSYKFDISQSL